MEPKIRSLTSAGSTSGPSAKPGASANRAAASGGRNALALLSYEADIRAQATPEELRYHYANETRTLIPYGQLFLFRRQGVPAQMQVVTASSLASVDRNAPLIRWLERVVKRVEAEAGLAEPVAFTAAAYADADDPELDEFPFGELMWTPLSGREDRWAGGALYARDRAWSPSERTLAERLAGTYAHALDALEPARRPLAKTRLTPRGRRILIASLIGTALFPVRLSVVAPVEVVPARAFVMAAPIDGVVDRILVAPNARVEKDQPLFVMDDTTLRNEAALALERRRVAEARYRRAASAAFRDPEEAREIAIAEAEFDLARAEADYASDQLALTEVRAPRAGIAVYSDRRDLEGKGVGVGERVMTIADPMAVEYSVELPPGDLIDLDTGVAVNIYLDSAPLSTINAGLDRVAYQTTKTSDGRDVFRLFAEPDADEAPQRIGARGSARIFGDWVPLIYRVLRRPLAAARQAIGL